MNPVAAPIPPKNPLIEKELNALFGAQRPTRWITRERPKIDRIACPWLLLRFIDPGAQFLYVPPQDVFRAAKAEGAVAYDIPGAPFEHDGDLCSFDAFMTRFALDAPGLAELAAIVRGADTARLDFTLHSAGLYAISLGLSRLYHDDHVMLKHGLVVYDALYRYLIDGKGETHNWPPKAA